MYLAGYELSPAIIALVAIGAYAFWWYWSSQRKKGSASKAAASPLAFGHDLTADARAGKLQPAIGRDDEIDRVVSIIRRRLKNNPLLIGEPGVGKTAIIEGLALRIVNKEVPPELQDVRIIALNLADMLSGTAFRGELEQRIRRFTEELESMGGKILLFIDEIHMIHQVKGIEGGLNLSDMLKPALARGELAVIGATTWHEYRDSLQKDPAIERRFQPVIVKEPSPEVAIEILRHLKDRYEKHHKVRIDDEAIRTAVELSQRMIKGRYLPDKAMDLIDEAAAKAAIDGYLGHRVAAAAVGEATEQVAARIAKERAAIEGELAHLKELDTAYKDDVAIESAERTLAAHAEELRQEERDLQVRDGTVTVTAEDVRRVIEKWKAYYDAEAARKEAS